MLLWRQRLMLPSVPKQRRTLHERQFCKRSRRKFNLGHQKHCVCATSSMTTHTRNGFNATPSADLSELAEKQLLRWKGDQMLAWISARQL